MVSCIDSDTPTGYVNRSFFERSVTAVSKAEISSTITALKTRKIPDQEYCMLCYLLYKSL